MLVHSYYPMGETRVEREAKALVARGYEVDVICLGTPEEPAAESADGIHIHRIPVRRHKLQGSFVQFWEYVAFFLMASAKLARLHLRKRFQVVQVHNLPDFLVFAALVPKLTGARVILDLHDLMPEFVSARFGGDQEGWVVRLVRWQESLSCRFADHVITVTELWRQALIRRGVPAGKVSVVMNVADDHIFRADPNAVRLSSDHQHFKLIYHGTFTDRYGLDLAIRAVDLVRRHVPGIHLTLHGGGGIRTALEKLVDELGLRAHVTFSTEGVSTSELPGMILNADVGIVPYRSDVFTDGILPTKLMEYAALGMPVIAARTTGIAGYFDDGMVEFFKPDDVQDLAQHILALYVDPERRRRLADGTGRFTRRYNWTAIGAEYVALVERLGVSSKAVSTGLQESARE